MYDFTRPLSTCKQHVCIIQIISCIYRAGTYIHKYIYIYIYERVHCTYYIQFIYYHEKPEVKTINQNSKWVWFGFYFFNYSMAFKRRVSVCIDNNIIRTWHVNTTLITIFLEDARIVRKFTGTAASREQILPVSVWAKSSGFPFSLRGGAL